MLIKEIVKLIEELSNQETHPDKTARMDAVFMDVGSVFINGSRR